jgi:hypothetical protein
MRIYRVVRIVQFAVLAVLFLVIFGFVVRWLWNWLMPALFGWRLISYWQALGMLVLSKILFGGMRGGPGRPSRHWRRRMMARWEQMTPEEREKFRQGLESRCWPFRPPAESKK